MRIGRRICTKCGGKIRTSHKREWVIGVCRTCLHRLCSATRDEPVEVDYIRLKENQALVGGGE